MSAKKLIFSISCLEHYGTVIACKSYKMIPNIIFFLEKSAKTMNAGFKKKYERIFRKTCISKSTVPHCFTGVGKGQTFTFCDFLNHIKQDLANENFKTIS